MSTRLTTGLLSCLMMSLLVGCVSSPRDLIRGQSPSAYPMPAGATSGHGFGAYSQEVPFPHNTFAGRALQRNVHRHANAYYGNNGIPHYGNGGVPISASYPGASYGGGGYQSATCQNGQCQNPQCQNSYCLGDCLYGPRHGHCQHCNDHGCPHCNHGKGHGNGGPGWAPTHLYSHTYKIPQGMTYPQNPTPGAVTRYPYYTHKGPDDFFYPALKK